MKLMDTVHMMASSDYKDRFRAEYHQTAIRFDKLKSMVEMWDRGELGFKPTCPRNVYDDQLKAMQMYLDVLLARAVMEHVDL